MSHKRRSGYWVSYHRAHTVEHAFLLKTITSLIRKDPLPFGTRPGGRGRPRVHSPEKMTCICAMMIFEGYTSRDTQNRIREWKLPWDEPVPDHSTIARFLEKIPEEWLEQVLAKTANACMDAACVSDGTLAADSTGVETDRYWMVAKPDKNRHKFTYARTKRYVKWHITALLGLQVILSCRITSSNIHDTVVLRTMLNSVEDLGRSFAGWRFNADKGYDSDGNC